MEKASTASLSKIELYHDGITTYYYDIGAEKFYLKNQNTLEYREQTKKLLANTTGISLTVGLFSIIVNRWYRSIATLQTQIVVLFLGFVAFIFLCRCLDDFIEKQRRDHFTFIPIQLQMGDVEDLLDKSIKVANNFRNICLISFLSMIVGIIVFLKFFMLIGLVLSVFSLLLSLLILRYLNIAGRYKVISHLRSQIIQHTNQ